jgi:hypothetical protein
VEVIHAFGYGWDRALEDAYTEDLWGAAYMIGGGASDDGFEYFRHWLVLQGREAFRTAVSDPNSLASIAVDPDDDYQSYECYPQIEAWEGATGEATDAYYDDQERTLRRLGVERMPTPIGDGAPTGEAWDFEDEAEARRRLPRLSERLFG